MKDRYIHYEKAGDEFVGRSVTGITSLSPNFAASSIYFEPNLHDDDDNFENFETIDSRVESVINNTIVKKENVSSATYAMVKNVVANICYNYDFLNNTLPDIHSLRSNPFFIAISNSAFIRQFATFRFPWNCTKYTPVFTGIPPHVVIMNEIEASKAAMNIQTGNIVSAIKVEMDERHLGGDEFQSRVIFDEMKDHQNKFFDRMKALLNANARSGSGTEEFNDDHQDPDFVGLVGSETEVDVVNVNVNITGNDDNIPEKGIMIQWENFRNGRFPSLQLYCL